MRFQTRDRHLDLAMVVVASLLLVVSIYLAHIQWIRIVLGLPFVLFFPGYALISALFPRSDNIRFLDLLGASGKDEGGGDAADLGKEKTGRKERRRAEREQAGKRFGKRWHVGSSVKRSGHGGTEVENGDAAEFNDNEKESTSIDGLERVALSFGLSIAVVPLIGLLLNLTYGWGDGWGIRENTVLLSILAFILITSGVAVYRRMRLPADERFNIRVEIVIPRDMSLVDRLLVVGIVVMLLASVGLLAYIIIVPREGEAFTEFYILGSGGMASDYPTEIPANETHNMTVGVVNHENREMEYTLVIRLVPAVDVLTNSTPHMYNRMLRPVSSLEPVGLSPYDAVYMNVTLGDNEKLHLNMSFLIDQPGDYRMEFVLYRTSEEPVGSNSLFDVKEGYRDLHLWVSVS